MDSLTWTPHTFRCRLCGLLCRASAEAIGDIQADEGGTTEQAVEQMEFCITCNSGPVGHEQLYPVVLIRGKGPARICAGTRNSRVYGQGPKAAPTMLVGYHTATVGKANDARGPFVGEPCHIVTIDRSGNHMDRGQTGVEILEAFDAQPAFASPFVAGGNMGGDRDVNGDALVEGRVYVSVDAVDARGDAGAVVSWGFETVAEAEAWAIAEGWLVPFNRDGWNTAKEDISPTSMPESRRAKLREDIGAFTPAEHAEYKGIVGRLERIERVEKAARSLLSDIEAMRTGENTETGADLYGPFDGNDCFGDDECGGGYEIEWANLGISAAALREALDA